ncbi:MAG: SDR family NAD(P)-dependent oxidoreductase [Flavobacteriaceae bacterium]|nr:SDR family NAD(P)-dependent oxidoreductase [Flavobacteriaceae bacterium]
MELGIAGRAAVVGASTEGLGSATAHALAEEGVRVCLSGRDAGRVAAAADKIRGSVAGAQVDGIAADLARVSGARALRRGGPRAALGGIDILVANVGGSAARSGAVGRISRSCARRSTAVCSR